MELTKWGYVEGPSSYIGNKATIGGIKILGKIKLPEPTQKPVYKCDSCGCPHDSQWESDICCNFSWGNHDESC